MRSRHVPMISTERNALARIVHLLAPALMASAALLVFTGSGEGPMAARPIDEDGSQSATSTEGIHAEAALLNRTVGPDAYGYVLDDNESDPFHGVDFIDISGTGTALAQSGVDFGGLSGGNLDDGFWDIPFSIPFAFYGVERNGDDLFVSTNGFATFDSAGATNFVNTTIPDSSSPNDGVFPFWDDLQLNAAPGFLGVDCGTDIDCGLYHQTVGVAPNRRFIIQWNEVPFLGDPDEGYVTFQVQFVEATREIRFEYEEPSCEVCARAVGNSATIGIESADPANAFTPFTGVEYSNDEAVLAPVTDVVSIVAHLPDLILQKNCAAVDGNPEVVIAGEQWVCRLEVINITPFAIGNVVVTDTIPADAILVETTAPGTVTPVPPVVGAAEVTFAIGTVPAFGSVAWELGILVPADYVALTPFGERAICNEARIVNPGLALDATARDCDLVKEQADLRLTKISEPHDTVQAGQVFTYTIFVDNLGPSVARNVVISDTLLNSGRVSIQSCAFSVSQGGGAITQFTCTTGPVVSTQFGSDIGTFSTNVLEPLSPSTQGRLRASFRLVANEAIDLSNTTRVTSDTPDPDQSNNFVVDTISVEATADLTLTKDADLTAVAGTSIFYTITVTNAGPSTAENVTIVDLVDFGIVPGSFGLTPGTTVTGCTAGSEGDPLDPLICQAGDVAAGETITLTFAYDVDPSFVANQPDTPFADALINDAYVFSDTFDPDTSLNRANVFTEILVVAPLSIDKTDAEDPVVAGEIVSYRIRVTNAGPSTAETVVVVDDLPDEVAFQNATVVGAPGTCTFLPGSPNQVRCDLGDVEPGFVDIVINALVDPATPDFTVITNSVTVTSDTAPDADDDEDTLILAEADLSITKSASDLTPVAGQQLTYHIAVTNHGPSLANSVTVTDTLPAGVTYLVDDDACVEGPPGTLVCDLGDIAPGQTVEFDIVVRVDEETACGTTLTNTAEVSSADVVGPLVHVGVQAAGDALRPDGADGIDAEDPDPSNNVATLDVFIDCAVDLRILKFGKPDGAVRAGDLLTYTLIVDNLGPSWAHSVVITDELTSNWPFTLVSVDADVLGNRPTAICTPAAPIGSTGGRLEVTCGLGAPLETFGPGNGTGRWMVEMVVTANETASINNTAAVSSADDELDVSNNLAHVEHEITDVADLAITKTAIGEVTTPGCPPGTALVANSVTAGRTITYTVAVTNNGPSIAENVVVLDRLPAGIVVTSATVAGGPGACTTGAPGSALDRLTCGLGTLAPAASRTVTIVAEVDSSVPDGTILENDAFVLADEFDDDNANNFAHNLTTVNAQADLAVSKTDQPDPVVAGTLLEYTITVENLGPSDALGVVVTDTLDPDVTFVGVRDKFGHGVVCSVNPIDLVTLTCTLPDIAAGDSVTFAIDVLVAPDATTPLSNTVVVGSDVADPCLANNADTEDTGVDREEELFVEKTDSPDPVLAGEAVFYTVTFGNNGPSTATNVHVVDTLPLGFIFNRCESLDPNDLVTCTVVSGNGETTQQVVRVDEIRESNVIVYSDGGTIDPGESFTFRLIADVQPGYILDGRRDTDPGELCRPLFLATGYPYYAHNRIDITSNEDADRDDECTRVEAAADLSIDKADDAGGFLSCDPVAPGGFATYTLTVDNLGPSDAAQVVVVDQLPLAGVVLDPAQVDVVFSDGRGAVVEIRDDGRVELLVGNDPTTPTPERPVPVNQLGRLNARLGPVVITITVRVALTAACGSLLENSAFVETRRNDVLWPLVPGALVAPTPTRDPNPSNNADLEATQVDCAALTVNKTVSFDGTCPGRDVTQINQTGQPVTFCYEIRNSGTTFLDTVQITDTIRTRTGGVRVIFTDTVTAGPLDVLVPLAPGEIVRRQVTIPQLLAMWDCGLVTDVVTVSGTATNSGRTLLPCLPVATASDDATIEVPCAGVDFRLQLPVIDQDMCQTWIQVQNVGNLDTKALIIAWGEPGFCPPQAAGPLKVECTGLLRPGSAWSFAAGQIPVGAKSAVVYSMNAVDYVQDFDDNQRPFADVACGALFDYVIGDWQRWQSFDIAYRLRGTWRGPRDPSGFQLVMDFGAHPGEPLAVTVNRTCPDAADPNVSSSAAYTGISSDMEGARDPFAGAFMFYAPLVFANHGGLTSWLNIQNSGIECTSLEIWFKGQDNCLRPILGDLLSLAPGETIRFDPTAVVGLDFLGSAWIRATQPMGIVVDTTGPNHFTSYNGLAADVHELDLSLGNQVNYAPLIYSEYQGWDTALQVQNLSGTLAAKVKVYFLDRSGGIITTLVDWICPRGSQTFFLPVIAALPGNWVGSARAESQEWWSPGSPVVDPPRISTVVLLEKWADPARTSRREAVAYNGQSECLLYDWQIATGGLGGTASGSAVFAIPLVAKGYNGITSEIGITNLVPKPGFTDFAIYLYDQNGLLDHYCQKLNEKQVEYIDLASWGVVPQRFLGSMVVSAVFWEHDVFDGNGVFQRNLVGLGGVAVERIGGTLGGPDVPGDESKAFETFPVFDHFGPESAAACPGVRGL